MPTSEIQAPVRTNRRAIIIEEKRRLTPEQVEEAIRQARAWAEERGVPLTWERVAACMGIDRERLRKLATGAAEGSRVRREAIGRLRRIYLDCNATLIEELMASKGSHSGALLLAKNDFGYTDKGETAVGTQPVRFVGEDRLEE